jgi:restriction endonuclease Mrr
MNDSIATVRLSKRSKRETRAALRNFLETADFPVFELVMKNLLYKTGFVSVQFVGRNHKRGRTPAGGLDLTARSNTELSSTLTVAQIKQYKRVVSRRFVDELRGVMLRLGANQGLMVTTSRFSKVAHAAAAESAALPISLIEGEQVLDLLLAYRIAVKFADSEWSVDTDYLKALHEFSRLSELDIWPKPAKGTYVSNRRPLPQTTNRKPSPEAS